MLGGVPQMAQFYGQSPELSYFDTVKDEAAFVKSRPPLPDDLAQSYRPPAAWPVSPTCTRDFILVCEFSELEGPKPLVTIPKDGGSLFDKNMFAVKIMAVDYNATNYARSTNIFKLSEDTSVLLEDKQEGTYSYIHHFTLYDMHARGFVRPFCMAYISPDKNKLRSNLEHITSCFQQVSQYFRYGNYAIFREEMVRRLADLIFTKENIKRDLEETEWNQEERVLRARLPILQNNHNPSLLPTSNSSCSINGDPDAGPSNGMDDAVNGGDLDEDEEKENRTNESKIQEAERLVKEQEIVAELKEYARNSEELTSVEKAIRETEVILEAINPALKKNKKMEIRFRRLKERYSEGEGLSGRQKSAQNIHQDGYCSEEDSASQSLKPRIRKRSSSHCEQVEEVDANSDPNAPYQPQIVRATNPRRFDRSLRTLHELCSWGAKEGLNRLRKLHKFYCRDGNILHLERQESPLVEPSVSLLTIGRTVTVNFLHAIDLQCIKNCHWGLPVMGKTSRGLSASMTSMDSFSSLQESSIFDSLPPSYEARFVMGSAYASLESLYYEVDESMEDLFLKTDPDSDPLADDDEDGLFIEEPFGSWIDISPSSPPDNQHSSSASSDPRIHPLPPPSEPPRGVEPCTSKSSPGDEGIVIQVGTMKDSESHPDQSPAPLNGEEEIEGEEEEEDVDRVSMETQSSKGEISMSSQKRVDTTSSLDSLDKYAASRSMDEPVLRRNNKIPVGCYASRLASMSSELPGCGIKRFISHYVFAIHLIYALLSGRTVVIAASPAKEREVNSLIRTLWMFVPGHSSRYHLVVPWHIKPLCMTDLARMKLVGLSRPKSLARVIPASVRRYVTLFEYDNNTLWTPQYKGTSLDAIVSRNKHFQTDQSYLAYVQSVLLQLASKAFLYYHSYCLNSPTSHLLNSTSSTDSSLRHTNSTRVSSASFLAKLGLTEGDCKIVEYWVELIKRQQIDEALRQQGCSDMPTPSIRLDHQECSRYQM